MIDDDSAGSNEEGKEECTKGDDKGNNENFSVTPEHTAQRLALAEVAKAAGARDRYKEDLNDS